ncbi:hypothetical protein BHE90_004810 [Fusarium euwallaceae]|uniref:Amidase domain-containing protein n=1 Tax=Fusarium euwallaceae TaxID=1147111 RepID=A0A430LYF3_9HYPO|nr:hypothetical protein BHE90_004810 [Fusarium euwallaceae]
MTIQLWRLTATQALGNIRAKNITIEQYASSLLERIRQRDDDVRAWAYLDPAACLKQAKELDQVPLEKRGPLHGLPVAVKDIIYTKDMLTAHGSPIYKDHLVTVDAGSVSILRNAGCLIFGKTTTTEFAAVFAGPKTRNAHSTARTPGGSSAGSGAAVADFQVPVALGSQTMGSIVRPAAFNGTYGFKPTWNAITREGQKFSAITFDTIGFFTRDVDDIEALMDLFSVHDDEESSFTDLQGCRIAVCKTIQWSLAGQGTIDAMEKAVELLKTHGAQVEEISLGPEFDRVVEWHSKLGQTEGGTTFLPEYLSAKQDLHDHLIGWVENRQKITHKDQLEAYDGLSALRPKFDAIASRYDAVLAPSVLDEAPEGLDNTGSPVLASTWTALHSPVINIPGFRGPNNMPVGVSLIAPRFRDRHLLKVGKAVGQIFEAEGGWIQGS